MFPQTTQNVSGNPKNENVMGGLKNFYLCFVTVRVAAFERHKNIDFASQQDVPLAKLMCGDDGNGS